VIRLGPGLLLDGDEIVVAFARVIAERVAALLA
jgi:hypothetical protein